MSPAPLGCAKVCEVFVPSAASGWHQSSRPGAAAAFTAAAASRDVAAHEAPDQFDDLAAGRGQHAGSGFAQARRAASADEDVIANALGARLSP
ncbi:hypothetical protein AWV80_41425 [Cupriavidus sp. UYMU48A]|nr:hypothetical protein AWV80_31325 [Cupriavidus sp. UYMU48A]KAF7964146.1 hypothetical protein AWV80_41425 [Cupriavidus sp. UYMU48A]